MEESDHHEIYVSCRCQLKMGAKTEVNAHEREFIFLDHEHRDTHPPFNKRIAQCSFCNISACMFGPNAHFQRNPQLSCM
jgi:hypothetical protein